MPIFTAIALAITTISSWTIGLGALGTFAVGNFLLRAALQLGISAIAKATAGDGPAADPFSIQGSIRTGGAVPRSFVIGPSLTAGSLAWHSEWGSSGGTPNAYYTQVIALSDLPIAGLNRVFINGAVVTLDTVADEKGFAALEYRENGVDHAWIKFYDGTQTAADTFLTGTVNTGAPRGYSNDRIGTGLAYAIVTFKINQDMFTGFPACKFVLDGVKLYDITKDTSEGGNGAHRWDDPATWGGDGDELPGVQAYNLARGLSYGGNWFYGLQGLTSARLPAAHWITQINKCRAQVTGESGLEPIYRCAGEITVNSEIGAAFEAILTACAGRMSEVGGVFKLYVGAPDAAIAHIEDDEILSLAPQTFTPFFGLSNTVNGLTASYPAPDEGYVMRATPPLYNADYEAEDGGRRLLTSIALSFVPFPVQAQRLLQGELAAARRARRHTFSLPAKFRLIEPGDTVTWTSARNGYAAKLFRVDGIIDLPNCDLIVDMTEVDPTDHGSFDYATDYDPAVTSPLITVQPTAQGVIGFNPIAADIEDSAGAARRAGLLMQWTTGVDDIDGIRFEIRVVATALVVSDAQTLRFSRGNMLIEAGLVPATAYEVRAKYIPASQRRVSWTAWVPVSTSNTRLSAADISPDAITWTELGQAVRNQIDSAGDANASAAAAAIAQTASEAAKTASEAARDLSQAARDVADASKASSVAAQGLAETAQGLAETAKADAETAQVSASTSSDVSARSAAKTFPSTFEDGWEFWTNSIDGDSGNTVTGGDWSFPLDASGVSVAQTSGKTSGWRTLGTRSFDTLKPGHTYKVSAEVQQIAGVVGRSLPRFGQRFFNAAGYVTGIGSPAPIAALNSYVTVENVFTAWNPITNSATFVRSYFSMAPVAGGDLDTFQIRSITYEDITDAQNASDSASAAATSEANAGVSEAAAGQSASAATTAKVSAETARGGAETAQASSATSESGALGSKNAAATSATQAANSATASGDSATAAAGSATLSSTKATEAGVSATNSAASYQSALASANDAAGDAAATAADVVTTNSNATAAGASASTATTQAGIASTKAGEASTSAGNAATSENNASGSENAAASYERLAAESQSAARDYNLIKNGSFSQDLMFWGPANNITVAWVSAPDVTVKPTLGAAEMTINTAATTYYWYERIADIGLTAGDILRFTWYAKMRAGFTTPLGTGMTARSVKLGGNYQWSGTGNVGTLSAGWQKFTKDVTVGDDGRDLDIYLSIYAANGTVGDAVKISDLSVKIVTSEVRAAGSAAAAAGSAALSSTNADAAGVSATNSEARYQDALASANAAAGSAAATAADVVTTNSNVTATGADAQSTAADVLTATAQSAAAASSAAAALTSEQAAFASEGSAGGSASIATTQAGIASTKAGEASTSAGNAATSETNAAGSASSASDYERLAAESQIAATNYNLVKNGSFQTDLLLWGSPSGNISVAQVAALNVTIKPTVGSLDFTILGVSGYSYYWQLEAGGGLDIVSKDYPAGTVFRFTWFAKMGSGYSVATWARPALRGTKSDGSYVYLSSGYSTDLNGAWARITGEVTTNVDLVSVQVYWMIDTLNGAVGDVVRVSDLTIQEVTGEVNAAGSAAAAASSASTASTKAGDASTSATAADASKLSAATSAGDASGSAGTAAGYAAAASVSETAAAASKSAADDAAAGAVFARDVAASVMGGGQSPNPIFAQPDTDLTAAPSFYTWAAGSGATMTRNGTSGKYGACIEYDTGATLSASRPYIYMTGANSTVDGQNASDVSAVEIDFEVEMISGTWGSAVIEVNWWAGASGGTSKTVSINLADHLTSRNGKVQRITALVEVPAGYLAGANNDLRVLFYGNKNGSSYGETDHNARIHRFDYRVVSSSASALISQKALTDIKGNSAASLVFRAKAGGAVGAVEIVAADDAVLGAASKIILSATEIELDGGTIKTGAIESSNYAEIGGVATAGFRLGLDGTIKALKVITTDAMADNSITKVRKSTGNSPSITFTPTGGGEYTAILYGEVSTSGAGAATVSLRLAVDGVYKGGSVSATRPDATPDVSSASNEGVVVWKGNTSKNTAITIDTSGNGLNCNLIVIETKK